MGCDSNNRTNWLRNQKSRFMPKPSSIDPDRIIDLGNFQYFVPSEKSDKYYRVNMISGKCECPVGRSCAPCKHKSALALKKHVSEFSSVPVTDPCARAIYHYVGTGNILQNSWYRPLSSKDTEADVEMYVRNRINLHSCTEGEAAVAHQL